MKHPTLALILLAILTVIGFGWLISGPEAPTGAHAPAELEAPDALAAPGSGAELVPSEGADEVATARVSQPAVNLAAELDPERTTWLAGRIELPAGCVQDETLEVFAFDSERDYSALALGLDGSGKLPGVLARVQVSLEGEFELPVDRELEQVWVLLRGRYLYLPKAVRVDPHDPGADPGADIVLTPTSGALVQGRVRAPAGVELTGGELGGLEVRFRTEAQIDNAINFTSEPVSWSSRIETEEDGFFELRAAPAAVDYEITVEHERFAALRETTGGFESCSVRHMDLLLERGGRVRGVVVDQEGEPVAEATVEAALPGKWFGFDDSEVRSTKSAADGSFDLAGVPSGHLVVRGEGRGYLESKKVKLDVVDGGTIEGITVALSTGKSITGTLTWPDGRPAAGVRIRARFDQGHMAGAGAFNALRGGSGEGESAADGGFVVAGLGNGPFVLSAEQWTNLDGTPAEKDADGAGDEEAAETEAASRILHSARQDGLSPGAEDVRLVLHPPLGVWGRVVDQDDQPVTHFEVRATRVSEGAFGEFSDTTRSQEFEDEDGRFLLENLIEGAWKLSVQGDEHVTLEPAQISLPADTEGDPVLVRVLRTAHVSGIVLSPDGSPVRGAEVSIDTGAPAWQVAMSGQEPLKTRASEDGTFELPGVPPQRIGLVAKARGYARSAAVTIELAPGETVTEVQLTLTEGGTLTGEVFDNAGEPAVGRMIALNNMKTFDSRASTADSEGRFRIEHLEPGTWQIVAMDRGADWAAGDEGFDMGSMMDSMKISQADIIDGETTHVVLGAPPEDPVRVTGKVTLGDEPYGGAMVAFFPEGSKLYERMQLATVAEDGAYALTLDGPGTYVVSISKLPGASGQQHTIEFSSEIPERSEVEENFELPLGRISGRVIGPDGEPASGARVTLTSAGGVRSDQLFGGQYTEIPTEADGTYDIVGLRPGTYRLAAGGAPLLGLGGGARFGRVTRDQVRVGEDVWLEDVDFRLPAPGSVSVVVSGTDGEPVEGANIFVRDTNGSVVEPFSFVTTNSTGKGVVPGLAPGEYTVSARVDSAASAPSGTVRVEEGETTDVELRLEDGAILWIKLRTKDGEPIKATVRVLDENGHEMGVMFGMQDLQKLYLEGGFSPNEHRLGPLPPGKYRVIAEGEGVKANKPVTIRGGSERKLTLRLK